MDRYIDYSIETNNTCVVTEHECINGHIQLVPIKIVSEVMKRGDCIALCTQLKNQKDKKYYRIHSTQELLNWKSNVQSNNNSKS